MPQHVNTESWQNGSFVVALLAHVAGVEVGLLVSRQVPKEPELLRTVFAGQVANCVTQEVFLVVAFVSEDLVASIAEKLDFCLLFFDFHDWSTSYFSALATDVLLHMLPQIHIGTEDPTAVGACVFSLTLVLHVVVVE